MCEGCFGALRAEVSALPRLFEEHGAALEGSSARMLRPRTGAGSAAAPGIRFNFEASEIRSEILSLLASWSGLVVDERGVAAPRRDTASLAAFLDVHLDWLAAHETASDAAEEFARLARRARGAGRAETSRRVVVGCCVERGCEGRLGVVARAGGSDVVCDADAAHQWSSSEWTRLARQLTGPAATTRWLSAPDIGRLWNMAVGSVYRHASVDGWRKRSSAGRTYYAEADVERTFAARRGRAGA
ncbi:hypothetical protein [Nocardia noduli]|uniref:hypothetical protein n=1 Tax=Nocardia noduli TaxID=2815722 RepID=UPI001C247619|nr:hypothetical protein [Nocardia noduli]